MRLLKNVQSLSIPPTARREERSDEESGFISEKPLSDFSLRSKWN